MYEFTPKKSNKAAEYTSAALLIVSLAAMFFSKLPNLSYRWVTQLAALLMFAVALTLLGRYVFKGFVYSVTSRDDGGYDLNVTEIKRRSRITVCRIALSGIEKAVITDTKNKKSISSEFKGRKVYNYCVDIYPEKYCCVFAEECGEKLVIKLSYDEKLFEILSR